MATRLVVLGVCVILLLPDSATAQIPRSVSYQGVLTDSSGVPKPDGSYLFTFRLYTAQSGGVPAGSQQQTLAVRRGLFHTVLDQMLNGVVINRPYWLGIQVGAEPELTPRIALTSVLYSLSAVRSDTAGYALVAPQQSVADSARIAGTIPNNAVTSVKILDGAVGTADLADNAVSASKIQNTAVSLAKISSSGASSGQVVTYNGSSVVWQAPVGGGLTLPYAGSAAAPGSWVLRVTNTASSDSGAIRGVAAATAGTSYGVSGVTHSASFGAAGVRGEAVAGGGQTIGVEGASVVSPIGTGVVGNGTATGGYFRATADDGTGVFGVAAAAAGNAYGVRGESASNTHGRGVYGHATAASGITYGGYFASNSPDGRGAFGHATSVSGGGYGLFGRSDGSSGKGVYGLATQAGGFSYGVHGRSDSPTGTGVYGEATASGSGTNATGGRFQSSSPLGTGVVGSGHSIGVLGDGIALSGAIGVYGLVPNSSGYAVYANGPLAATGTKSFQVDHPLRPETHYLNHFCTEGPEPFNVYSGNVTTDGQGMSVVHLPDYFESINRDFRYQLTCIGQFAQAIVSEKIRNNRFVIRTDKPGVEVSWRVEATRNDLWVQRYGYQTEPEKAGEFRGRYLTPVLYGQPPDRGIYPASGSHIVDRQPEE